MSLERRAKASVPFTETTEPNHKLALSEVESMARDLRVFIKNEAHKKSKEK
jgi:hypothetical protein